MQPLSKKVAVFYFYIDLTKFSAIMSSILYNSISLLTPKFFIFMEMPNVSLICLITKEKYDKVKKILQGGQKMRVKVLNLKTNKESSKTVDVVYDVNETDHAGRSILMYAVVARQYDIAIELLRQGAKVDVTDEFGCTFVGLCAVGGCYRVLKAALDMHCPTFNKVLVNKPYGSFKSSALHAAVNGKHYLVTKLLLQAGADPNVRNHDDKLPIEWPIASSDFRIVHLLLKYGARVDLPTHHGETLLLFSLGNNFEEGWTTSCFLLGEELKYDGYKERLQKAYEVAIKCQNVVMAEEILNILTDFPQPPKIE